MAEPPKAPKQEAALKLGSREGRIPGKAFKEKVDRLAEWGASGIELGAGNLAGRADELKKAIAGVPVEVSAVCPGHFSLIAPDAAKRQEGAESTLAAVLGRMSAYTGGRNPVGLGRQPVETPTRADRLGLALLWGLRTAARPGARQNETHLGARPRAARAACGPDGSPMAHR